MERQLTPCSFPKRRKEKMKILNKKAISIIAIVLLMSSIIMIAKPGVSAAVDTTKPFSGPMPSGLTANVTAKSTAYLSFRPNPVGLNQPFIVNIWVTPAPGAQRKFLDLTVTITKPDGTQEIIKEDSYPDDGTAWFEYVADQVGTWKLKFDFPGTYMPAGRYSAGNMVTSGGTNYADSVYMQPSSTVEQTLIVQEAMVASWPSAALPTDYWTRPVPYENREWWPILGNYPWRGQTGGPMWDELYPDTNSYWMLKGRLDTFIPWVQGPNSAHVAWKRQTALGGIIGGDYGYEANTQIFQGNGLGADSISAYGFPSVVVAGRAYEVLTKPFNGETQYVWRCYDLRTGEVIWETKLPTTTVQTMFGTSIGPMEPNVIEYAIGQSPGGGGDPTHVTGVYIDYIGSQRLVKFDPFTGGITANYSIAPLANAVYYMNGYCLSVQDLGAAAGANRYRLINWTTLGTLANLTTSTGTRVASNTSWPISSLPTCIDFQAGVAATAATISRGGIYVGMNAYGIRLSDGQVIWNVTRDETPYSASCLVADHGKFAILTEQGYFLALNINTGAEVWKSDKFDYPWDEPGFGAYDVQTAYGLLYRQGYSGVYAFNWETGKRAWKFVAPAENPYETPYVDQNGTVYSWNMGARIADGKMYAYTTEHSATVPITRGWKLFCINATSGDEIWSTMLPGAMSKHTTSIGPIADGYLTVMSSDGFTYVYGKGKSQTTVEAPMTQIASGESVIIKGTVLDLSPGQPGTACVSKESMGEWMAHLHKGLPVPANVTGVLVSIDAVDPNNNAVHLGEAVSDMSGTYGFVWTPDIAGKYTITATFMGDDSYGSSWAQTYANVVEAAASPTPTTTTAEGANPPYELYTIGTGIAVIIAVAIVGLLILRKRP
jgi:outer membrane protein assembly factor BamB